MYTLGRQFVWEVLIFLPAAELSGLQELSDDDVRICRPSLCFIILIFIHDFPG